MSGISERRLRLLREMPKDFVLREELKLSVTDPAQLDLFDGSERFPNLVLEVNGAVLELAAADARTLGEWVVKYSFWRARYDSWKLDVQLSAKLDGTKYR